MSPNLYIAARTITHPCAWFQEQGKIIHRGVDFPGRFPVEGLYHQDPKLGIRLIAVRNQPGFGKLIAGRFNSLDSMHSGHTADLFISSELAKSIWCSGKIRSSGLWQRFCPTKTLENGNFVATPQIRLKENVPKKDATTTGKTCGQTHTKQRRVTIHNIEDWKFLVEPMPVSYQPTVRRYMFDTEVHHFRTITVEGRWSEERDARRWKKGRAEYFLLDDNHTWILKSHNGKPAVEREVQWYLKETKSGEAQLWPLEQYERKSEADLKELRRRFLVGSGAHCCDGEGKYALKTRDAKKYVWLLVYLGLDIDADIAN